MKKSLFVKMTALVLTLATALTMASCMEKRDPVDNTAAGEEFELKSKYFGEYEDAKAELNIEGENFTLSIDGVIDIYDQEHYDQKFVYGDIKADGKVVFKGTAQISDQTVTAIATSFEISNIKLIGEKTDKYIESKTNTIKSTNTITSEQKESRIKAISGEGSCEFPAIVIMQMLLSAEGDSFELVRMEKYSEYGYLREVVCYENNKEVLVEKYKFGKLENYIQREFIEEGDILIMNATETVIGKNNNTQTTISAKYDKKTEEELEYYEEYVNGGYKNTIHRTPSKSQEITVNSNGDRTETVIEGNLTQITSFDKNGDLVETSQIEKSDDGMMISHYYYPNGDLKHYSKIKFDVKDSTNSTYFIYEYEDYRYVLGDDRLFLTFKVVNEDIVDGKIKRCDQYSLYKYHNNGQIKSIETYTGNENPTKYQEFDENGKLINEYYEK